MPTKDYYAVLHLDPSADASAIERAYWHRAWALQETLGTDSSAGRRLEALNEAYAVLGTPALRDEYDQARQGGTPAEAESLGERRASGLRLPLPPAALALAVIPRLPRLPSIPASAWSRASVRLARRGVPEVQEMLRRRSRQSQPAMDPSDLRASTVETIARWRQRAETVPPLLRNRPAEEATPAKEVSAASPG